MSVPLIDRAIAYFSPSRAVRRHRARLQLSAIRKYDAAQRDRLAPRIARQLGPVTENREAREEVLARARDLDRNNSWAHGILNSIVDNVVGPGITLQSRIRRPSDGRPDEVTNRLIEATWQNWAAVDGFAEKQRMALRERWIAGEVLILRRAPSDNREIPLAIEIVESERLAPGDFSPLEYKGNSVSPTKNRVVQGVEFNPRGDRVAYWIYRENPHDTGLFGDPVHEPVRVPAADVIHLYRPERPGAVRGMSRFAPAIRSLEALNQYLDYELTRARIASAFAIMIKRRGYELGIGIEDPDGKNSKDNSGINLEQYLEGGIIFEGGDGDSIEGTGPSIQTTALEQFATLCLRSIAAGLNVSYELIARDFSKTNFSSARQSALEDRRHWEPEQNFFKLELLDRVFAWFREAAIVAMVAPFRRYEGKLLPHAFMPPGWPWVDPVKEVAADKEAVRGGFASPQEISARRGRDFFEVLDELAEAQEAADRRGVALDIFGAGEPPEVEDEEPEEDDEADGEDEEEDEETEAA